MKRGGKRGRKPTFNKHRTYLCPCGAVCVRELHGESNRVYWCGKCGRFLSDTPFQIDDTDVISRNSDLVGKQLG